MKYFLVPASILVSAHDESGALQEVEKMIVEQRERIQDADDPDVYGVLAHHSLASAHVFQLSEAQVLAQSMWPPIFSLDPLI